MQRLSGSGTSERQAARNAAGIRRSTRVRRRKEPLVMDLTNRNFRTADGVHHSTVGVRDGHLHVHVEMPEGGRKLTEAEAREHVLGILMAQQYSIRKGMELFKEEGEKSAVKELTTVHTMNTFVPVAQESLTREQKLRALRSLLFLTKKRCGRIKSRFCADGSVQRKYTAKEDATSPTVITDSIFITGAIEAHEGREVMVMDLPGAFLHADNDEETYMLLKGQLAELMAKIEPSLYRPYIFTNSKGESMLYVRMQKALYGMLRSALLFYLKLVEDLRKYGFKLNPYDPCVANATINGSQMTVTWHVDDLKVSHKDSVELTKFALYMSKIYGDNITVNRGKVHDYLGMDLDYSTKGEFKIAMIKYLMKIFEDFPEEIRSTAPSPAADHLFNVRDASEAKYLTEEQAKHFHHAVAQLLFVSARARRDIQTAVSFLTTRVKKPDEDDWGKLKRVLKYLKGTLHMKLTITVDDLSIIKWWVDASYNIHDDCKGHSGAMMSFGKGAALSFSRKQKVNCRSSTESELVGIDDALPSILWARYFIEEQGRISCSRTTSPRSC